MKPCALLLALAVLVLSSTALALDVETLRDSGPVDKRFNLVVLGDGYRTQDQAQLSSDAKNLLDYVFGVSPFKEYAAFFNVKLIHVISNDNGADNGQFGGMRDTALGAYFNCGGIQRLLCVDDGQVQATAAANVKEFNFALVIVNDTTYGGSGGTNPATSINEQSFEIVAHEIGHSMAGLADEYESPDPNYPVCDPVKDCNEGNVTLRSMRDSVKWNDWIEEATPVPTPDTAQYASSVGLFEGARYLSTGMYRPYEECKMRDLGNPYCPVCREQFVLHYWNFPNISIVEDAAPAAPVTSSDCQPITFSITSPPVEPSTYEYTWTIDAQPNAATTNQLVLDPKSFGAGQHTVAVSIKDATAYVRTDPQMLLAGSHSWSLNIANQSCTTNGSAGASGSSASGGAGAAGSAGMGGTLGVAGGAGNSGNAGASTQGGATANGGAAAGNPSTSAGDTSATHPPPPEEASCHCSLPRAPRRDSAWLVGIFALAASGVLRARRRRALA